MGIRMSEIAAQSMPDNGPSAYVDQIGTIAPSNHKQPVPEPRIVEGKAFSRALIGIDAQCRLPIDFEQHIFGRAFPSSRNVSNPDWLQPEPFSINGVWPHNCCSGHIVSMFGCVRRF